MASCALKRDETGADNTTKCAPCSSLDKSALLIRSQVERHIQESIPLWTLEENSQTLFLSRKFVAKNFATALDSINQMGAIAEREGHHPDFHLTSYREVEVNMWTHKLNGITENDIQLAEMLDKEVNVVYSPKWLKEHPEAAQEE
jgi:4a-hydroxytetrahydrobiopterin dehydratase